MMPDENSKPIVPAVLANETPPERGRHLTREKRITIAQFYGRFRATRKLTQLAVELRGAESSLAREARISEEDAWNSLQIMKALMWLDDE